MFQIIFKTVKKYFEYGKFLSIISPLILIFLLLIIWQIGILIFDTPNWMLPSPVAIFQEIIDSKNILFKHSLVTLNESFWGLLLAIILGVFLFIFRG